MPIRRLAILLCAALVASTAGDLTTAGAEPRAETTRAATTTLLVVRESGTSSAEVVDELQAADIAVGDAESMPRLSTTQVEIDSSDVGPALGELRAADGVSSVVVDQPVAAFVTTPNDPGYGSQWGTRSAHVDDVWPVTTGSADVVIAVVDSGVNVVPDLAGRVLPGRDLVNNDNDAADDHGHGTEVATVAAAAGNDGQGIAGACWSCRILPVKVLAASGSGSLGTVANGVVWAVDHGADVINLSLGGTTNVPVMDTAINYATSRNVVVLGAAGNDGASIPNYPAGSPGAIAVAASDPSRALYSFSNYGAGWADIAAPGCNTATGSGSPSSFCGTSSATPLAAGIVGLLRSAQPGLNAAAIRSALEASTLPLATAGLVSTGTVDAANALSSANTTASIMAPSVATADTTAPSGQIVDPGAFVSGTTVTSIDTADNIGVATAQLFVNGSLVGSGVPGTDGRVTISWFTGWVDGPATLTATIVDQAGNLATTERVVRIDNRAPTLHLSEPRQNAKVGKRFNVTVSVNDANDTMMTLVAVGGKIVGGSRGNGTYRFNVASPRSGRLQVVAAAVDHAGHISFSNIVMVTAKVKAPARRR